MRIYVNRAGLFTYLYIKAKYGEELNKVLPTPLVTPMGNQIIEHENSFETNVIAYIETPLQENFLLLEHEDMYELQYNTMGIGGKEAIEYGHTVPIAYESLWKIKVD